MLILQICDFLDDGDGHYRLHGPSRYLSRLVDGTVIDCHYYHRLLPALVEAADVLVLPFIHNWDFFPVLDQRRAAGQISVFEANDYFYDVQPWSPVAAQWQDRAIQEEYRLYMGAADAVQTSTAELARRWQPWARRVAVFVNHLAEVPPLPPPPARPLTIGWGGSPGHFADWYHVAPLLQRWLAGRPDVHVAVMTNAFARPFLQVPPERYHFTPFGTLAEFTRFLGTLDIGLAPLLPSDYNRGRSDVKFLEYAAHGVAGIYADLEPYRGSIVPGETGLLYRTEAELLACLDRLADDAALRQRIRTQAHAHVARHRRIEDHIGERLAFYRELLPAPPRHPPLPDEVLAVAERDGRYLQLRPQQPERTLLDAIRPGAGAAGISQLTRLVEEHPRYAAALYHLGRLLNDARESARALPYLERALALAPRGAAVRCEMGRSRFILRDPEGARRDLEAALALNPLYLPGWQYLLRLLRLTRSPDGPRLAERSRQLFPANYALALAGLPLYPHAEAVRRLHGLLREQAASFKPEELPMAAAAFGEALRELGTVPATPDLLELLRQCTEVFPQSARLAHFHGQALHQAGRYTESQAEYVRALGLQRGAATYQAEFPREDGSIHYWQFADHIRKWAGTDGAPEAS